MREEEPGTSCIMTQFALNPRIHNPVRTCVKQLTRPRRLPTIYIRHGRSFKSRPVRYRPFCRAVFAHTRHSCKDHTLTLGILFFSTLAFLALFFDEQRSRVGFHSQIIHHMDSGIGELLADLGDQNMHLLGFPTQGLGVEAHVESL